MPYKDPIKKKEHSKVYRKKHSTKLKLQQKRWREEHKEHLKQWSDKYYAEHKEEITSRNTVYSKTHPEIRRKIEHKRNQKQNAPYHEILLKAGRERVCESCGAAENVHTHHKDLNHDNNELSNLQWLCGSCHSKLHAELRRKER